MRRKGRTLPQITHFLVFLGENADIWGSRRHFSRLLGLLVGKMAQTERCTASQATLFRCFRRSSQCRDLPRHSGAECIPQISRFLTQKSKICVIWGIEDLFAAAWMRYGMARGMKRGPRGTPFAALKENPVSLEERCFAAKPRQLGGALPGFRFKAPGVGAFPFGRASSFRAGPPSGIRWRSRSA